MSVDTTHVISCDTCKKSGESFPNKTELWQSHNLNGWKRTENPEKGSGRQGGDYWIHSCPSCYIEAFRKEEAPSLTLSLETKDSAPAKTTPKVGLPSKAPFMTTQEVADFLGCSAQTVRTMRKRGEAPPHFMVGSMPRYITRDLPQWVANSLVTS